MIKTLYCFDRMGRRTFYKEEVNGEVTKHHRFVYDNYLCVQKLDALNNNSQINLFVWDPTESVATRPLFTQRGTGYKFFYTCEGNKNVSELVHFETRIAGAIQNANKRGRTNRCDKICVSVYAHSQGTMVARRGFDYLRYVIRAHSDLANVTFCGYGGETSIEAEEFGLRNSQNTLNGDDFLRWASPRRWFDDENGNPNGKHEAKNYF